MDVALRIVADALDSPTIFVLRRERPPAAPWKRPLRVGAC
jgi:hypothetical protein